MFITNSTGNTLYCIRKMEYYSSTIRQQYIETFSGMERSPNIVFIKKVPTSCFLLHEIQKTGKSNVLAIEIITVVVGIEELIGKDTKKLCFDGHFLSLDLI